MPVRFVVHEIARPSISDWYRRLCARGLGGQSFATTYFQALREELIRTAGLPKGGHFVGQVTPPVGVWEFQFGSSWVVYVLKQEPGLLKRLLGRSGAQIIMIGLFDHPPLRAELTQLLQSLSVWDRKGSAQ
jgi:hypothetical protein